MSFVLNAFLTKIVAGLGLDLDHLVADATRIKEQFPDSGPFVDAMVAELRGKLAPELDAAGIEHTLRGIALDLWSGMTGVDPGAWRGAV